MLSVHNFSGHLLGGLMQEGIHRCASYGKMPGKPVWKTTANQQMEFYYSKFKPFAKDLTRLNKLQRKETYYMKNNHNRKQ